MRRGFGVFVGTAALALTAGAAAHRSAANGPIGYLRQLGGNEPPYAHLFVATPDGGGAHDITPPGYSDIRSFTWSPDGTRLASALADGDTDAEIYVMPANGGPVTRLTDNHLPDYQPTWSPDGRSIAFVWNRDGNQELYRVAASGGTPVPLTNTPGITEASPRWRRR